MSTLFSADGLVERLKVFILCRMRVTYNLAAAFSPHVLPFPHILHCSLKTHPAFVHFLGFMCLDVYTVAERVLNSVCVTFQRK